MEKSTNEYPATEASRRRRGPPKGNRNALKTGFHTAEMKALRRRIRVLRRRANALCDEAARQIRERAAAQQAQQLSPSPAKSEP